MNHDIDTQIYHIDVESSRSFLQLGPTRIILTICANAYCSLAMFQIPADFMHEIIEVGIGDSSLPYHHRRRSSSLDNTRQDINQKHQIPIELKHIRPLLIVLVSLVVNDVEELKLVDTLGGRDDTEPVAELHLLEELLGPVHPRLLVNHTDKTCTFPQKKESGGRSGSYRYLR